MAPNKWVVGLESTRHVRNQLFILLTHFPSHRHIVRGEKADSHEGDPEPRVPELAVNVPLLRNRCLTCLRIGKGSQLRFSLSVAHESSLVIRGQRLPTAASLLDFPALGVSWAVDCESTGTWG